MKFTYVHFDMLKNIDSIEYAMNSIHILLTGAQEKIRIHQVIWVKIIEG